MRYGQKTYIDGMDGDIRRACIKYRFIGMHDWAYGAKKVYLFYTLAFGTILELLSF